MKKNTEAAELVALEARDPYETPAEVLDGVWIPLRLAPTIQFKIRPPTRSNDRFQFASAWHMQSRGLRPDLKSAELTPAVRLVMLEAQQAAFIDSCIVTAQGLASPPGEYLAGHRGALVELWQASLTAADRIEGALVDNAGK